MQKAKILFVTPCTIRGFSGNITRFEQVIGLLNLDYEVHFLSLVESAEPHSNKLLEWGAIPSDLGAFTQASLRLVYKSIYVINRLLVEARLTRYYHFGAFDLLARLLARFTNAAKCYSHVYTNYIWTARGMGAYSMGITVVDLHDLHADRHSRIGKRIWVNLSPKDEIARIQHAGLSVAIAQREYDTLLSLVPPTNLRFLPYWPRKTPPREGKRKNTALFLGSANEINVNALSNFQASGIIDVLFDLGIEIAICGSVCETEEAQHLRACYPSVNLLGQINDLSPLLSQASYGLNLSGPSTGLKVKTVDYLNAGLRVLATEHGVDDWLLNVCADQILIVDHRPLGRSELDRVKGWLTSEFTIRENGKASAEMESHWIAIKAFLNRPNTQADD